MRKVSYIPLENILMTPCQECQEKVEFSITEEAVSSRFIHKFILASTLHERTTLET